MQMAKNKRERERATQKTMLIFITETKMSKFYHYPAFYFHTWQDLSSRLYFYLALF